MKAWLIFAAAALALSACDRAGGGGGEGSGAPKMEAPSPDAATGERYDANSERARAVTGLLTMTVTQRMDGAEHLSISTETGLTAEAQLVESIEPSAKVGNDTLRALMQLDVSVTRVRLYSVSSQTKPNGARGFCDDGDASHFVVWESREPGREALKILSISGGAPGASGAAVCGGFAYTPQTA